MVAPRAPFKTLAAGTTFDVDDRFRLEIPPTAAPEGTGGASAQAAGGAMKFAIESSERQANTCFLVIARFDVIYFYRSRSRPMTG